MSAVCPFAPSLRFSRQPAAEGPGSHDEFPLMPLGEAVDMGTAPGGTPLFDPRIFHSAEFLRNPYPYYHILRDHYPGSCGWTSSGRREKTVGNTRSMSEKPSPVVGANGVAISKAVQNGAKYRT